MLTQRQQLILDFIQNSIQDRGYPPTLREIGNHMGIRSTNGVNDHLKALMKKGVLVKDELKSRAIKPTTLFTNTSAPIGDDKNTVEIPILGKCQAGAPHLAFESKDGSIKIDKMLVGTQRDLYALRVRGDSMINAGILDGDFLFVKKQPTANPGEIVVAMINDEATVKYFYPDPEKEQIILKPANDSMKPIVVHKNHFKSVHLLGTVVGVYRKLFSSV